MKLGFIGAGNMAGALIRGTVQNGVLPPEQVFVYDIDSRKSGDIQKQLKVHSCESIEALISACDMLLLAVKPNVVSGILDAQRSALAGKALISIAAGWTVDMLRERLDDTTRLLRVMPNTPALCGNGMAAFSLSHSLSIEESAFAEKLFRALGRQAWVPDDQMDAVTGLSGSSPAYAYLFIEALADGGVYCGLTRPQALEMAAQTLKGAAEMVLETGLHPGALKDMVCSPHGTTIAGVHALEEKGFRGAVMDAVIAGFEKSREMSKSS